MSPGHVGVCRVCPPSRHHVALCGGLVISKLCSCPFPHQPAHHTSVLDDSRERVPSVMVATRSSFLLCLLVMAQKAGSPHLAPADSGISIVFGDSWSVTLRIYLDTQIVPDDLAAEGPFLHGPMSFGLWQHPPSIPFLCGTVRCPSFIPCFPCLSLKLVVSPRTAGAF